MIQYVFRLELVLFSPEVPKGVHKVSKVREFIVFIKKYIQFIHAKSFGQIKQNQILKCQDLSYLNRSTKRPEFKVIKINVIQNMMI
jgi:hypothetical protein